MECNWPALLRVGRSQVGMLSVRLSHSPSSSLDHGDTGVRLDEPDSGLKVPAGHGI